VSIDLLGHSEGAYQNTSLSQVQIVRKARFWYWAHVDDISWHAWENLGYMMRSGRENTELTFYEKEPEAAAYLLLALYQGSFEKAQATASSVDLSSFGTLLDIGGGTVLLLYARLILTCEPLFLTFQVRYK
jgi:hypothetical protein